jgi:hypothetical protein
MVAVLLCAVAVLFARTWFEWQREPAAHGGSVNGLWARHRWAGQPHTEAEYEALAGTLARNRITDVFFHVGPLDGDGNIPPSRYGHAGELLAAMRRLAPAVRAQAYVGQVSRSGGGPLDLGDARTRARVLDTDRALLGLGFPPRCAAYGRGSTRSGTHRGGRTGSPATPTGRRASVIGRLSAGMERPFRMIGIARTRHGRVHGTVGASSML